VRRSGILLLAVVGCSDLTGGFRGVVALEVRIPQPAYVEPDDTLQLQARALDADGDSVNAPVYWRVLDTTLILADSAAGRVTTALTAGTGRVQARTGAVLSDLVTLNLRGRSDTLVVTGADTLRVPSGDTASAPLRAAIQSATPPGQGVANAVIVYQVEDTLAAAGRVRFQGGGLRLRALTGSTGEPALGVTLRRVPGVAQPDTVRVRISASRPSGAAVPGSGQQFVLLFDP